MPNKKNKMSKAGKRNNAMLSARDRVEIIAGRTLFSPTPDAGSITAIPLYPTSFPRCLAIADNFEYYRFTKLRVIHYPAAYLTNGTDTYLAYSNGTYDTPPGTFAAMAELPFFDLNTEFTSIITGFTVNRQELLSDVPLKWFKTVPGSQDVPLEVQGNLYYGLGGVGFSTQIDFVVEWICELSQWNLVGQSPMVPKSVYECIDLDLGLYRKIGANEKSPVKGVDGSSRPAPTEKAVIQSQGRGDVLPSVKKAIEA